MKQLVRPGILKMSWHASTRRLHPPLWPFSSSDAMMSAPPSAQWLSGSTPSLMLHPCAKQVLPLPCSTACK